MKRKFWKTAISCGLAFCLGSNLPGAQTIPRANGPDELIAQAGRGGQKGAVARKVAAAIKEEVVLVAAQIRVEEMPVDMFRLLTEMRAVGSVVVVRFTHQH